MNSEVSKSFVVKVMLNCDERPKIVKAHFRTVNESRVVGVSLWDSGGE